MNWIDSHIENYFNWIKNNTNVFKGEKSDWFVIETPVLGLFNDNITIYAKKEGNEIQLSDDGETLTNLEFCGVNVSRSKSRREALNHILLNYGISEVNGQLNVITDSQNFAQKKHNLVSAISDISELHVLAKQKIASVFREDVKSYLDEEGIIYTPQFIARGSSGIEFTFDFQLAGRSSEKLLHSFNKLNKQNITTFLYGWEDVKSNRESLINKEIGSIALINDVNNEIDPQFTDALKLKGADIIYWSERHKSENREKLVA